MISIRVQLCFASFIALAACASNVAQAATDPQTAAREQQVFDAIKPGEMIDSIINPRDPAREQDPLRFIASDMGEVVVDLGALKTDEPVQEKQAKVVAQLDRIIALLEKQKRGSGKGGGANPAKPMNDSVIASGPGGQGELHDAKGGIKQWGALPPKQREQILQSKTEGFPAGYESILQSYYNRLAQEKLETEPSPEPGK